MQLTLEFGGGLELLCDSVKVHNVDVVTPKGVEKLTMKDLLSWVRTNLIKERPEMFMKEDTVRPGVLVLVNDCDWELSGQLDTTLEEKDVTSIILLTRGSRAAFKIYWVSTHYRSYRPKIDVGNGQSFSAGELVITL